jgi:hypothetical protein
MLMMLFSGGGDDVARAVELLQEVVGPVRVELQAAREAGRDRAQRRFEDAGLRGAVHMDHALLAFLALSAHVSGLLEPVNQPRGRGQVGAQGTQEPSHGGDPLDSGSLVE